MTLDRPSGPGARAGAIESGESASFSPRPAVLLRALYVIHLPPGSPPCRGGAAAFHVDPKRRQRAGGDAWRNVYLVWVGAVLRYPLCRWFAAKQRASIWLSYLENA